MKAVYLDFESLDKNDLDFSGLHAVFDELVLYPGTLPEQVLERVQRAEVIISNKVVLNAETLQQCPQLKLILISATGTNNVDLQQARQQGITVCNCQGYGTSAVAQHTLMLMLNLATSFRQYDSAAFAQMKPSAFLINCARGGVVNEQALADALRSGQIAGAATDVLTAEPPKDGNVLLDSSIPNLIVTPHSAWGSVDARQRIVQQLIENTEAFKAGLVIRKVN